MFLPLLASMLLTCEQYDWLKQGVFESTTLSTSEKTDIIFRFIEGTDPNCFNVVDSWDAND